MNFLVNDSSDSENKGYSLAKMTFYKIEEETDADENLQHYVKEFYANFYVNNSIRLSLNSTSQHYAFEVMDMTVDEEDQIRGSFIYEDPSTGDLILNFLMAKLFDPIMP